jgi:hypothetical protein
LIASFALSSEFNKTHADIQRMGHRPDTGHAFRSGDC